MIIANIRSARDLEAKKDLQKQLIELEVANEAEKQKRYNEKGRKEVKLEQIIPEYKSSTDILKDKLALEKKALDFFIELGFNYSDSGQLANWLAVSNRLADFVTSFKLIKKDVQEKYDKSIIGSEFIKNYLDNYFDDLDTNLGKTFSKDVGTQEGMFSTMRDPFSSIPDYRTIKTIKDALDRVIVNTENYPPELNREKQMLLIKTQEIKLLFDLLDTLLPSEDVQKDINQYLNQNERNRIVKKLLRDITRFIKISPNDIVEISGELNNLTDKLSIATNNLDTIENAIEEIDLFYNKIFRLLSPLAKTNSRETIIRSIQETYQEYINIMQTKGVDYDARIKELEKQMLETERIREEEVKQMLIKAQAELALKDIIQSAKSRVEVGRNVLEDIIQSAESRAEVGNVLEDLVQSVESIPLEVGMTEEEIDAEVDAFLKEIVGKLNREGGNTQEKVNRISVALEDVAFKLFGEKFAKDKKGKNYLSNKDIINRIKQLQKQRLIGMPNAKDRTLVKPTTFPNLKTGLGANPKLLSKLKKHFKGDEALLKKVAKALEEDSSSDEEDASLKELSRHIKATDKTDKKIEKLVGGGDSGVSFRATRIPVSKVGRGVKLENEENPTYRQFGKYVLHIPYLLNNNTANFKYPSLGSIPTLKPLKISDDYKDLIIETLQTGKLNKKEFERLPQSEIKHFERVVVGAGLVEQLGLKLGNTDEDKTDTKRFELLRGEYLAGNNNADLIKELRHLITKFITNGRIHKNEGLNLLLELSTF